MKLPKTITSSLAILTMVTGSHGLSNVLETEICESLAEQGKCETQPKVASEFCQKSCDDWYVAKGNSYYETFDVEVDDSDAFYELEAKSWTGDDIKFSKFDGFITCIANIGIICTPGEDEILSKNIDELRKEMPYTVELFIFPFSLNDDMKTSQDCKSMNKAISKKAKNLHIMDMITLNGDGSHDVFKHLKKIMGKKDDFKEDRSTFFFVNPVASRIDVLEGAQLSALRKHVKGHLNGWEDEM